MRGVTDPIFLLPSSGCVQHPTGDADNDDRVIDTQKDIQAQVMYCCARRYGLMKTRFSPVVLWPMVFSLSNGFVRNIPWQAGDSVVCPIDNNPTPGIVKEDRGRGWYSILLSDSNTTIKCRGTQLVAASNSAKEESTSIPISIPDATKSVDMGNHEIHDLDSALREATNTNNGFAHEHQLDQVAHHASYDKWVGTFEPFHGKILTATHIAHN